MNSKLGSEEVRNIPQEPATTSGCSVTSHDAGSADVIDLVEAETLSDQRSFVDEISQFYNMAELSDVTIKVRMWVERSYAHYMPYIPYSLM